MKISNLNKFIKINLKHNQVPMLIGEPGIGKSSWIRSLADELKTKCFIVNCNQLADKADLTGARLVKEEGEYKQKFYPHIEIANAINYAEKNKDETPILFLDEINRTTPDVTSAALSIPTDRSIGSKKLPDNLKVIIAGNDHGNVSALDTASITRFVSYKVKPDVETFFDINPDLNETIRELLIDNPTYLCLPVIEEDDFEASDFETLFPTPRTITALSSFLNDLKPIEIKDYLHTSSDESPNLMYELVENHIGKNVFSDLIIHSLKKKYGHIIEEIEVDVEDKPSFYNHLEKIDNYLSLQNEISKLEYDDKIKLLFFEITNEINDKNIFKATVSSLDNTIIKNKDLKRLLELESKDDISHIYDMMMIYSENTQLKNTLSVLIY